MDLSDFRPKSAFSMILSEKVKMCGISHFFATKRILRLFLSKTQKKPAWTRNLAVANAILVISGAIVAKKRKRADFAVFG